MAGWVSLEARSPGGLPSTWGVDEGGGRARREGKTSLPGVGLPGFSSGN